MRIISHFVEPDVGFLGRGEISGESFGTGNPQDEESQTLGIPEVGPRKGTCDRKG
jgi:hypothetical protein